MHLAGHKYPGHTEILAELTDTKDYAMMLVTDELKVIHVSTHVSLGEAIERVGPERELAVIRLAHESLRKLGVENPRVAVAGLNPHAGENGLFGTEDAERIAPAVAAAVEEGIDATGPHPPDTVMMRARTGAFDIVVVQYHDQGHIPIKLMGFDTGVNVTVGLPFFRTSVDHGTAFDIAGTGEADPSSLRAALDLARTAGRDPKRGVRGGVPEGGQGQAEVPQAARRERRRGAAGTVGARGDLLHDQARHERRANRGQPRHRTR